jgi:hypothetical protein
LHCSGRLYYTLMRTNQKRALQRESRPVTKSPGGLLTLKGELEMFRRLIAFPACVLICFQVAGCSMNSKFNYPQGTRVGIVNLLESDMTHTNFSSFGQDNFTKTYAVNWQIPSYAENQLMDRLKKNKDLMTVKIQVADPLKQKSLRLDMVERVILSRSQPPTIPSEGAALLESIADPHDVQVVIVIGSYNGPSVYKSAETTIFLQGYGLFTRFLFTGGLAQKLLGGFFSFRKAYAYAQIGVIVYSLRPVTYVGLAQTSTQGRPLIPLADFDWKVDIRNLPESELAKVKPKIERYIDDAIEQVLKVTNLAPSGAAPEEGGSGIGGAPAR